MISVQVVSKVIIYPQILTVTKTMDMEIIKKSLKYFNT
jgi:hypothetical protein